MAFGVVVVLRLQRRIEVDRGDQESPRPVAKLNRSFASAMSVATKINAIVADGIYHIRRLM